MPRSMRHFGRMGLAPIPSPTHFLTGRGGADRLSYWVPLSDALRNTDLDPLEQGDGQAQGNGLGRGF
jgi:hypothetical protein